VIVRSNWQPSALRVRRKAANISTAKLRAMLSSRGTPCSEHRLRRFESGDEEPTEIEACAIALLLDCEPDDFTRQPFKEK
jgi:hypothetical protein